MKIIRPATIADANLIASTVPEEHDPYSAIVSYDEGEIVTDPAAHHAYESMAGGNLGNDLADPSWWLDLGVTNRWRMFDKSNGSQTEAEDGLAVDLLISERVNSVALLNVEAGSIRIVGEVGATTVYDRTFPMTATSGVNDWYDYFFEPIVRRTDLIVTDLPTYSNMALSIEATRPGGTVKIGTLVAGQLKHLGMTLQGMSAGIIDYSRKGADDFGNVMLVERAFSKKLDARVVVENSDVDDVMAILSALRATPVVWIGASAFSAAGVFGFYRNFSVTFEYPTQSICLLEIEGLK